ncbi:hypothetical protein [Kitasatospora sp. NPDC094016]|uniref:hypothetical protein n=1 Tax=Kitasatospora sp. NPDC094016 TaxID=3154986 RepID=UPI003320954C
MIAARAGETDLMKHHLEEARRHPYRHQTEAAVRQLLADGVEIGERAPGPTLVASTYPNGRRQWRAGLPLNGLARS